MLTPAGIVRSRRGGVRPEVEERLDTPEAVALAEGARNWFGVEAGATIFLGDEVARLRSRFGFPHATAPIDDRYLDLVFDADGALLVDDTEQDDRFGRAPVEFAGLTVRRLALYLLRAADGEPAAIYCLADPTPKPGFAEEVRDQFITLARRIELTLVTDTEIDRAAEVQRSLLPNDPAPLPGYRIAGFCQPAREVGGDFFDWYRTPDGLAFVVADVMGKGLGSAIIAAAVRATIRSARRKDDPTSAVRRAADALGEDLDASGAFVTLVHGRIRADDGQVRYVDAGHGLALLVPADGEHRRLMGEDAPLGLSPEQRWSEQTFTLEPGDTLVLCSDGVLDLADGTLSALDAVAAIVRLARSVDDVIARVEELARTAGNPDDVTLVAIRRDPVDESIEEPVDEPADGDDDDGEAQNQEQDA